MFPKRSIVAGNFVAAMGRWWVVVSAGVGSAWGSLRQAILDEFFIGRDVVGRLKRTRLREFRVLVVLVLGICALVQCVLRVQERFHGERRVFRVLAVSECCLGRSLDNRRFFSVFETSDLTRSASERHSEF